MWLLVMMYPGNQQKGVKELELEQDQKELENLEEIVNLLC